jgi:hypothetical protein
VDGAVLLIHTAGLRHAIGVVLLAIWLTVIALARIVDLGWGGMKTVLATLALAAGTAPPVWKNLAGRIGVVLFTIW